MAGPWRLQRCLLFPLPPREGEGEGLYAAAAANAGATYRAIRSPSPRHPTGWMAGTWGTGPSRQDALLLLRCTVWYPAQGQGECGYRFRALGGVPGESRYDLSQRGQTLPPGQSPGPAPDPAHAQHERVSRGRLARGTQLRRGPYPPHPGPAWSRRLCTALGGVADQREGVPDREVCPPGPAHQAYRLQWAPLYGSGGGRDSYS